MAPPTLDAGGVTAEFAVAMPAVVLVLAACVGGIQIAATQVRVQAAAADGARSLARGDGLGAATSLVHASLGLATLTRFEVGDLTCARVESRASGAAGLVGLELTASCCDAGAGT